MALAGRIAGSHLNFLVYQARGETYLWLYADTELASAVCSAGRWADDPELAFGFSDASLIRKAMMEAADACAP